MLILTKHRLIKKEIFGDELNKEKLKLTQELVSDVQSRWTEAQILYSYFIFKDWDTENDLFIMFAIKKD